jgi:hypothetical protein
MAAANQPRTSSGVRDRVSNVATPSSILVKIRAIAGASSAVAVRAFIAATFTALLRQPRARAVIHTSRRACRQSSSRGSSIHCGSTTEKRTGVSPPPRRDSSSAPDERRRRLLGESERLFRDDFTDRRPAPPDGQPPLRGAQEL